MYYICDEEKLRIMGGLIYFIFIVWLIVRFIKDNKSGAYDRSDFGPWNYN